MKIICLAILILTTATLADDSPVNPVKVCVDYLQDTVKDVNILTADFKSKEYIKFIGDLEKTILDGMGSKNECELVSPEVLFDYIINLAVPDQVKYCLIDLATLNRDATYFMENYKIMSLAEIAKAVEVLGSLAEQTTIRCQEIKGNK